MSDAGVEAPRLRVAAFTVGQLVADTRCLDGFEDPHNYLRSHDAAGIRLLADNPNARDGDLALILAVDGQTVVGRLALYAGPAPAGAPEPRLLWLSGYFLRDEYRSTGAGGMLMLRALGARMPLLAAGGPSADLQRLYDSTGYVRLPRLRGFFGFYNPRVVLGQYVGNALLRALLMPLARLALGSWRLVHRAPGVARFSFEPCRSFSSEVDGLVPGDDGTLRFPRDHTLLNWVLRRRPTTRGFLIREQGRLVGYCILGKRVVARGISPRDPVPMTWGLLVDYQLAAGATETLGALLAFCDAHFAAEKVDAFYCQGSDPALAAACRHLGMVEHGGALVFYRPGGRHKVDAGGAWSLTNATADLTLQAD